MVEVLILLSSPPPFVPSPRPLLLPAPSFHFYPSTHTTHTQAAKKQQSAERKKLGKMNEGAMLNVFMAADADSNGTISHKELIGLVRACACVCLTCSWRPTLTATAPSATKS